MPYESILNKLMIIIITVSKINNPVRRVQNVNFETHLHHSRDCLLDNYSIEHSKNN